MLTMKQSTRSFNVLSKTSVSRLLCSITILLASLPLEAETSTKAEKPVNVLWIIAEDMSKEQGSYGYHEQISTPNIDSLSKRGMTFDNVFTTAPICSTSRSALMTGMHAATLGAHNHRTDKSVNQLYNLANDPTESIDVASSQPEELVRIMASMIAELERQNAQYPIDKLGNSLKPQLPKFSTL